MANAAANKQRASAVDLYKGGINIPQGQKVPECSAPQRAPLQRQQAAATPAMAALSSWFPWFANEKVQSLGNHDEGASWQIGSVGLDLPKLCLLRRPLALLCPIDCVALLCYRERLSSTRWRKSDLGSLLTTQVGVLAVRIRPPIASRMISRYGTQQQYTKQMWRERTGFFEKILNSAHSTGRSQLPL